MNVTLDQEVAIVNPFGNIRMARVTKVTPSGQVVVKPIIGNETLRFCRYGQELGGSKYHRSHIDTNVAALKARSIEKNLRTVVAVALSHVKVEDHIYPTWSLEAMESEVAALEVKLAAARAAVDALRAHVSADCGGTTI